MRVIAHPKNIFLFLVLVIPFALFAQEKGKISGSITDKVSRAPLVGVTVMVKGTYYGASSNLDGKFSIQNVNPGTYTIQFSLIGYKKVQQTGEKIAANNVDILIGVRGLGRQLVDGAKEAGLKNAIFAEDSDAAGRLLVDEIKQGDVVLVKGSRGVRTEKVIEQLLDKFELEDKTAAAN